MDCNVIDGWLEGVEYAVPRPPKKPGGWMTDRRQLSLVLSLVLFLILGSGDSTAIMVCVHPEPWSLPRDLVSVCGGVMLWGFRGLVCSLPFRLE